MRSAASSSSAAWRASGFLLFVAYPATAHFAPPAATLALLAVLGAYVLGTLFVRHPARWLLPAAAAGLFLVELKGEWLLYVPPIAINVALCWLFGRTLMRGRVPLIARFALMEQPSLPEELARYARALTWLWTLLFAAAAAASLALALSGNRDAWSLFTNLVNYLLVAALFLGELAWRRVRFPRYRHASPLQLLRNVRRSGLFER